MMQRIRRTPALAGLPIIASSASVFSADQHKSLEAGADDFLPKPVQLDELLQKLQEHLKLTWIYEPEGGARSGGRVDDDGGAPSSRSEPDVVPPSAEDLAVLLDLTQSGLIHQIQRYIDKLDRADPKLAPFIKHLRHLSEHVRLEAMEQFIKKYTETDRA